MMTLQELGENIRQKREAAGFTIEDVATRIKVSSRTLRAIEKGATEGLPHAVYTKGFVRSFALAVGYDPEELNAHLSGVFPAEIFDDSKPERLLFTVPAPGPGKKIFTTLLILCILAGLAAGGWFVAVRYGTTLMEMIKQPFSAITISVPHSATAEQRKTNGHVGEAAATAPLPENGRHNAPATPGTGLPLSPETAPAPAGVAASAADPAHNSFVTSSSAARSPLQNTPAQGSAQPGGQNLVPPSVQHMPSWPSQPTVQNVPQAASSPVVQNLSQPAARIPQAAAPAAAPQTAYAVASVGYPPLPSSPVALQQASLPAAQPGSSSAMNAAPQPVSSRTAGALSATPEEVNQVYVRALRDCYISSRADGVKGRAFTLEEGKAIVLAYKTALELSLGNAGGVVVYHNGKNLGQPGQEGQVRVLQFP